MDVYREMITWIYLLITLSLSTHTKGSACCDELPATSACRQACERLSLRSSQQHQLQELSLVVETCTEHTRHFWQCINNTFIVVSGIEQWSGRSCCDISLSYECSSSCYQARSKNDITGHCQQSDEVPFFRCLERQEVRSQCCGMDTSATSQCRAICMSLFLNESPPTRSQRNSLARHCSAEVEGCVLNYTQSSPSHNPAESLPCCDMTSSDTCRTECKQILVTMRTEQEIVDGLIRSCGSPSYSDPLWQCFLLHSGKKEGIIHTAGIDGAKLQCCGIKSVSPRCRDLCVKTYSTGWATSVSDFHIKCQHSHQERALVSCLQEVEEPCQLGCQGLKYCSNLNNRPAELFRSCNARTDAAAQRDVEMWERGTISLPGMSIPVLDIKTCQPEKWKAIACSLQIKPCHRRTHVTMICKSDCLDILNQCIDHTRLPRGQTVQGLCDILSPTNPAAPCLSLSKYMVRSPQHSIRKEVTHPCNPNPCNASHVCVVNRRKCKHSQMCKPYVCKPGCPLGEVSTFFVPRNTYVRVPHPNKRNRLNCHKICRCGHHGNLEHCVLLPCTRSDSCFIKQPELIPKPHDTHFTLGCNHCSCHEGELICSQRHCIKNSDSQLEMKTYTGLPCKCTNQYVPVCGRNGKTYPNACVARCSGLRDDQFVFGACGKKNPCDPNPCASGYRCHPRRRVCLNDVATECRQYQCIPETIECSRHDHDPVCDTSREEFSNLCTLLSHGRRLAHHGHCREGCQHKGEVCGHDGETYLSECHAWAARTAVDYYGACQEVGVLQAKHIDPLCSGVQCPLHRIHHCKPLTPPGACCPICAGEIRILFSRKQINKVTRGTGAGPISVQNVTKTLSQFITTPQCDAFGYLSVEAELVVLVVPVTEKPTPLQIQACVTEAQRLAALIKVHSPTLFSHAALSVFTTADVRTSEVSETSSSGRQSCSVVTLCTGLVCLLMLSQIWRVHR